jgi:pimeloyl-ACP methyl ester carboxylesterase
MVKRRKPSGEVAAPKADAATFAPALNAGFQATTSRVQEMHQAISGKTFDNLLRVPGLSVPTRIVQGLHDAITQGVYAAVRHGGGAALSLASQAERIGSDPARVPGGREQSARSALNGVFGDELLASGSALAIGMKLYAGGAALALTPAALQGLHTRVCIFIHGLACDEQSWAQRSDAWRGSPWADALTGGEAMQYGSLLVHELGLSAIYLRYNTGLAIDNNAQQFAALLARVADVAPQVREWVLIGHSMGGLVARRAHALAAAAREPWAARTPLIVCLGSPHQGAPLEQLGQLATTALNVSDVTRPLGRIANARSQGIKDLRGGLRGKPSAVQPPALRMVFGTLGDEADSGVGSLIGKLFGDGLVMPGSAADDGLAGDVERVELAGLGHMALLNHPRVYTVLRRWLGAPELTASSTAAPAG